MARPGTGGLGLPARKIIIITNKIKKEENEKNRKKEKKERHKERESELEGEGGYMQYQNLCFNNLIKIPDNGDTASRHQLL